MIAETTRRSRACPNKKMEVNAKFPIVLLQRLQIGANAAMSKENLSDNGITPVTKKSCKFKKKVKRLESTRKSVTRFSSNNNMIPRITDEVGENLGENTLEASKLLVDTTVIQTPEISSPVSPTKKLSEKVNTDSDKNRCSKSDSLITENSVQKQMKQDIPATEQLVNNTDIISDTSRTEETIQVSTLTRSRLLRKSEINVQNTLENSSPSLSLQDEPLVHETTPKNTNHTRNTMSKRNKSREVKKTDNISTASDFGVEINNQPTNTDASKKVKSTSEIDSQIKHNDISNSIKTRSKGNEATKVDNRVTSVPNSTPKKTSNKIVLNTIKIDHGKKRMKSANVEDSNNKKSISTRSKLLEENKTDNVNDTVPAKVALKGDNFIPNSFEANNDNPINRNALESISSIDETSSAETINKENKISTRSNASNKKHIDELDKNVEPVQSSLCTPGKKSLPRKNATATLKSVDDSLTSPDSVAKNIVSTRNSMLGKEKVHDNKKMIMEKSNVDVVPVQSNPIQCASPSSETQTSIEISVNEKLTESSNKNSTRTSKKIITTSKISTRSRVDKTKADDHEKCTGNAPNHSPIVKNSDQSVEHNIVKDNLKLLTDTPDTKEKTSTKSKSQKKKISRAEQNQLTSKQTEAEINNKSSVITSSADNQEYLTNSTETVEKMNVDSAISMRSKTLLEDKVDDPANGTKPIATSTRTPKTKDLKSAISTRSKLPDKSITENHGESKNEAVEEEQNHLILNASQAQNSNESTLDSNTSQLIPQTSVAVSINDSTRSRSTRKAKTNVTPMKRKKKAVAENQDSEITSQTYAESSAQVISDVTLVNNAINCSINSQQQDCSKREIVIKLFRCDHNQSMDNCSTEKETPKKKIQQGKRKREHDTTVLETPKDKKSKQENSNDINAVLPILSENEQLIVNTQVPIIAAETIDKLVVETQNNVESNTSDINVTKSTENLSEDCEPTPKDICFENVTNINAVDNLNCVTESPKATENEISCDNERAENEKEIIVNSSGDNNSVHEEELLDDRDEGISVDTSENETTAEIHVDNDDVMIVESSVSTNTIRDKESHSALARRMVEEVINDWTVADDDKTDNVDNTDVTEIICTPEVICTPEGGLYSPEVIEIDDNDDEDIIVDTHQQAVNTERDPSHNLMPIRHENAEYNTIDISNSPPIPIEMGTTTCDTPIENKQRNNVHNSTSEQTSEQTSEISEPEDVDSNFESIDENSCAEILVDANTDDQENNVSQETITYYNSEDISIETGTTEHSNRLNDVGMNLKDACDKITADLSGANTSYENNEEPSNVHEPELLYISDDSAEEMEEDEEEVVIIDSTIETPRLQLQDEEQQRPSFSNHLRQILEHGTPSISVIKASELRDERLEPPIEYSRKRNAQSAIVFPQRQMHSTTLLPASIISGKQSPVPMFTEDTIMQCPKCRCDFVGKSRLRRHWLTCGDAMYLNCSFCTTKVKQRRSLLKHISTQHQDEISGAHVIKIVESIVKQTRDAATAKVQQGCTFALRDLLRTTSTIPIVELPAYIRVQCVVCNKTYDEIPATYKKVCDDCSSDLMTAICQLCRKQYMLTTKVAVHVQGNCIFSGRIKCRDCDFVSSSRYHLQEHIISKHIYVAPEDFEICRLGCGKTFRSPRALKKHELICGKEADLSCRFCDYKTKHRSAMKMHVQQHIVHEKVSIANDGSVRLSGQKSEDKDKAFDEDRNLTTEQEVRSVIRVHCSRCNLTHRLTSNRSSCEICKLSFTFSCSLCPNSKRMDSLHSVRLHVIRTHCVKTHECPNCPEKFSYVYDLTKHVSKCKGKTIQCDLCNFRTNEQYKLRQHERRVHFTAPNASQVCKKCGKWFHRGDSLKRHETMHCGVEPKLSCEHCQFKTKTKFSLLRHIQSQHAYIYENFNFVCDRCNKFYTNMFSYEQHVKNCHVLYKN